jgi:glutamate-5-semialdehyde dehydrogenase
MSEVETKSQIAKKASRKLAYLPTEIKNKALLSIAKSLIDNQNKILEANKADYQAAEASGMNAAMLDRLMLSPERIKAIAEDVKTVASLPDPVGDIIEERTLPNGLKLIKRRVPLGVIAAIYESRPNVTVDIASLCLKSGNAVVLRGGKESLKSNLALAGIVQKAAYDAGIPEGSIQFIESTDRKAVEDMLKMRGVIDLMIPRGGAGLINMVRENGRY